MEALTEIRDYTIYRDTLRGELQKSAEGFVRIGYLLKQARDTDILKDSGYSSLTEFAMQEYGLTKDVVSRYIAINDKYSIGGNSDRLIEQYKDYGYAKLTEMLTLPDTIAEEIGPDFTKQEIREIKEVIREEQSITDIEVAIEAAEQEPSKDSLPEELFRELFSTHPDLFVSVREIEDKHDFKTPIDWKLFEAFAPSGMMLYTVRIAGKGTMLIGIHERDVTITNSRTNERNIYTWEEVDEAIWNVNGLNSSEEFDGLSHKEAWSRIYGRDFPEEKEEVAPAQPKKHVDTGKQAKKEQKLKTKPEPKPEPQPEPMPKSEPEEEDERVFTTGYAVSILEKLLQRLMDRNEKTALKMAIELMEKGNT